MASAAKAVVKICDMPNDMLESTQLYPRLAHPPLRRRDSVHGTATAGFLHSRVPSMVFVCAAALTETEYAFTNLNTEKEVAQAVRNAFVKKVRRRHAP